ncbi:phosphoribosylaminoimidazolesuccinocarboxamide synthase [Flindersiella endophytica]
MELMHSGKVRDIYADGDDLILVASDRVSVYDVVLPTPIPDKGKILTQLSLWWFDRMADIMPNHVLSATDVPPEFAGRAIRCRRLEIVPVECVARGYLAGSGLGSYRATGKVNDVELPPGLLEGSRLPAPIFTPTTKAPVGEGHDEPMTYDDVVSEIGADLAERLRDKTMELYERGAELALEAGVVLADTKFEFGLTPTGELLLADEIFTPDSSRFWSVDEWEPGRPQRSLDKQIVRDWATGTGWDKKEPGPDVPTDVVVATQARYVEVYERLTGGLWLPPV